MSMFARLSLCAFLVCSTLAFVSCKNKPDNKGNTNNNGNTNNGGNQEQTVTEATRMSIDDFEKIIGDETKINDYLVVDVRYVDNQIDSTRTFEYQAGHTFCAISIPFNDPLFMAKSGSANQEEKAKAFTDTAIFNSESINNYKDKNIILQCRTDNRSQKVGRILAKRGFKKLFWIYGTKAYKDGCPTDPDKDKKFKAENKTIIPAILESQIDSNNDKITVLDVRSKADFDKGSYKKGKLQARHCPDPAQEEVTSESRIVVVAANAKAAYTAAKVLLAKLEASGFTPDTQKILEQIKICVEPPTKK